MKIHLCSKCDGRGSVRPPSIFYKTEPCPTCKGSGRVILKEVPYVPNAIKQPT